MVLTYIPLDLPGKLYRSPMPFARFDPDEEAFNQFLEAGITTVVMLIEEGEDQYRAGRDLKALYLQNGMEVIHFPIADFDTPEDKHLLDEALQQVLEKAQRGENIAVHCFAGRGRTGMFLALLVRQILGVGGEEAIATLRDYFPAVETKAQEQLVINYEFPKAE
jgi:protein-tyrosine phosphatase